MLKDGFSLSLNSQDQIKFLGLVEFKPQVFNKTQQQLLGISSNQTQQVQHRNKTISNK
jgi:hypothetical protein